MLRYNGGPNYINHKSGNSYIIQVTNCDTGIKLVGKETELEEEKEKERERKRERERERESSRIEVRKKPSQRNRFRSWQQGSRRYINVSSSSFLDLSCFDNNLLVWSIMKLRISCAVCNPGLLSNKNECVPRQSNIFPKLNLSMHPHHKSTPSIHTTHPHYPHEVRKEAVSKKQISGAVVDSFSSFLDFSCSDSILIYLFRQLLWSEEYHVNYKVENILCCMQSRNTVQQKWMCSSSVKHFSTA